MSYEKRMEEERDIGKQRREWERKYNPINLRKEIDENREYINKILKKLKAIEIVLVIPQLEIRTWIEEKYKDMKE